MLEWEKGKKHPDTPVEIYFNVRRKDRNTEIFPKKCRLCNWPLNTLDKAVAEIAFQCDNVDCQCHKVGGKLSHFVCDVCFNMWHALYSNTLLMNWDYFKDIDSIEKRLLE